MVLSRRKTLLILLLIALTIPGILSCQPKDLLQSVYLTWQSEDTSTTMTVNYVSRGKSTETNVYYDEVPRDGAPESYRYKSTGVYSSIRGVSRKYHSSELKNLKPGTTYYFIVGDETLGYSREYKFRTLPNDDSPIRIVQGGDMDVDKIFIEVSRSAMAEEPQAILIGGDIAYANGLTINAGKWDQWLSHMEKVMITPQGYLVPLIVAIGNHETNILSGGALTRAPFFFHMFPQHGDQPFFTRKLGANSVLFVLDTGHIVDHKDQVQWLREQMQIHRGVKHKLAMYHVPLYPSYRPYSGKDSELGRVHWVPVFDEFGLTLAFENHDHTLKRSKLLKNNQVVSSGGTMYVGDGCWGKGVRNSSSRWYLEKFADERHVWNVLLTSSGIELKAQGSRIFDQLQLDTSGDTKVVSEK